MKIILALDLAVGMGFAFGGPSDEPTMGTVSLRTSSTHDGAEFCALIDWLSPMIIRLKPVRVIYEAPLLMMPPGKTDEDGRRRGGNAKTMAKLIGYANMVDMLCYRRGVRSVKVASQTVRKLFIGTGRHPEPKQAVMVECRRRGWRPVDHNAADAAATLAYAISLYYPAEYRVSYRTPA